MAKAKVSKASDLRATRAKAKKSFVGRVHLLRITSGDPETRIALIFGFFVGPLCPISAYVIFHILLPVSTGMRWYTLAGIGLAAVAVSLYNVFGLMLELTKSRFQAVCYALMFEGLAMVLSGSPVAVGLSLISLAVVGAVNWIKMAHNGLIKTD